MNKDEIFSHINLNGYIRRDYNLKIAAKYVRMMIDASLKATGLNKTYKTGFINEIDETNKRGIEAAYPGKEFSINLNNAFYKRPFSKPIYTLQFRNDKQAHFTERELLLIKQSKIDDPNLTKIISSTLNEFGFKLK